jgi:hypothetical protein
MAHHGVNGGLANHMRLMMMRRGVTSRGECAFLCNWYFKLLDTLVPLVSSTYLLLIVQCGVWCSKPHNTGAADGTDIKSEQPASAEAGSSSSSPTDADADSCSSKVVGAWAQTH